MDRVRVRKAHAVLLGEAVAVIATRNYDTPEQTFCHVWQVGAKDKRYSMMTPSGHRLTVRRLGSDFMDEDILNMSMNIQMLQVLGIDEDGDPDDVWHDICFYPYLSESRFSVMTIGWLMGEVQRRDRNICDFFSPSSYTPSVPCRGIGGMFGTGDRAHPSRQIGLSLGLLDEYIKACELERQLQKEAIEEDKSDTEED